MRPLHHILILIVIGCITYVPSLFGGFIWDDEDFVYENTYVRDFRIDKYFTENIAAGRGKVSNYFRPLQMVLYGVLHNAVGFTPIWFHLANIALHVGATLSLYLFVCRITANRTVSLIASLFFLVHPVQTESVTYISGVSDSLFVLFGFFALITYDIYKKTLVTRWYLRSLLMLLLCLLSKETGLVFVGLLVLLEIFAKKKHPHLLIPIIGLAALYFAYHTLVIDAVDIRLSWQNTPEYASSPLVRVATFIRYFYSYLGLIVFPKQLFMERDAGIVIERSLVAAPVIIFLLSQVGAVLVGWKWLRHSRNGRIVIFSYLSFHAAFLPYSGIVLINGIFYEHFLYVPLAFAGILVSLLFLRLPGIMRTATICIVLILLIVRSWMRQYEWIDPVRFYEQTRAHAPNSYRVLNNLAMTYAQTGQTEKAMNAYAEGITQFSYVPNFYHNLANLHATNGDITQAERFFELALEVEPTFSFSRTALIELYGKTGQNEKLQKLLLKKL